MKIAAKNPWSKNKKTTLTKIAKSFLIFLFLFRFSSCTCSFLLFCACKAGLFQLSSFSNSVAGLHRRFFYTSQVVRLHSLSCLLVLALNLSTTSVMHLQKFPVNPRLCVSVSACFLPKKKQLLCIFSCLYLCRLLNPLYLHFLRLILLLLLFTCVILCMDKCVQRP